MKHITKLSISIVFTALFLTSCGDTKSTEPSTNSTPETSVPTGPKKANVFILSGQSNMEGNTRAYPFLDNYCEDNDIDSSIYYNGFSNVQISFYNHYDNSNHNYSNEFEPMDGFFTDTMKGQGVRDTNYFGPELGIAEQLSQVESDVPTYLIKFTSGGTGFGRAARCGYGNWDWRSPSVDANPGELWNRFVEYTHNCLDLIVEEEEYQPVIKGMLWMQGETDACNSGTATSYLRNMLGFISDMREEFAEYAPEEDGANIAWIDADIQDTSTWPYRADVGRAKAAIHENDPNSYLINTNKGGLELKINNEEHGGGDQYHYTADSMIRLGHAFGDILVKNLLD